MKKTIKTIFVMMALLAGTAEAAVCTSLSAGNWNWSGRWSCGHVPNNTDDVVIAHNINMNTNPNIVGLTMNAGVTLDDNGNDLTVTGSVLINGTYDGTGNNGNLIMEGNGQTLSGTGTIIDIGRIQIDANTTIPAGSNLNLTLDSEIRVGDQNNATLTIDGIITGTGQNNGSRIIRLDNNNTSNVILNGTINAPNSYVEIQSGGTITNNGTAMLQYLDGDGAATATWTQGVNSSLTLSQPTQSWSGTFNASAVGNTVTWNAPAAPLVPGGNTYYNLAGSGVTCPHGFSVLGSDPCSSPVGSTTITASPTACVDDAGIGSIAWTTLTGPLASDNVYAIAQVADLETSHYLKCTGYGFAIPPNAIILGITVGVERYASNTNLQDAAMRVVKGGVIGAADRSNTGNYPTADPNTLDNHGGYTDLWGEIWTAADINAANFGAALATRKSSTAGGTRTVRVDHMPITVTYSIAPGAEYRMDEASWNGTANEVADNSGNGLHGTALLGSTTAPGKICNAGSFAANYAQAADNALLDITNNLTVTAWIKPDRCGGAPGKDALMSFYSKDTNYEAHVTNTCRINWWWGTGNITSAAVVPTGSWTHVAMVWKTGEQRLYINGALSASGAVGGVLPANALPFQIGDDQSFGGGTRRFDGQIDELKIFNVAMSAAQVSAIHTNENAGNNWDGSVRVCPVMGPDHLRIEHVGSGVTCSPTTLTIKACADASCSSLYTGGVTGTLTATGTPTVNWVGGAGFSIGASGSATKDVQVTTAGTVTWGATSVAPAPSNATSCYIGATASCSFTSALAGFLFDVPNHVSDTTQTITVSAVKQADNSLACTPAFASVSKTVSFGCSYSDPASGTLPVTVGGSDIACGVSGGVNLSFNASGVATPTVNYADVGLIGLTASYTGSGGSETGLVMTGSDSFIAAPASFAITATGPYVAGSPFSATVTARNASGNATPNFGNETAPEGVTLTSTLVSPVGGSNPALTNGAITGGEFGASGMVSDANGVATVTNLSWAEVGNITLDAVLTGGDYLGSGLSATGSSATVGPFIPEHLDVQLGSASGVPMTCPTGQTCPSNLLGASGFVYSGQPFSVQVTARNLAGGTTANYDGTLGFSKGVMLSAWDALGSIVTQDPGGGSVGGGSITAATFVSGVAVTATPTYTFGTVPTVPTDIYVRATDADSVSSRRASLPGSSVEPGLKIGSGRIKVSSAYGSELLPLGVTATVQYWDGSNWLVSTTDSNSTFDTVPNLTKSIVTNPLAIGDINAVGGGVVTVANGIRSFTLAAPGVTGSADIGLDAPTYLQTGSILGRVTFGVYSNRNNYIYRREN